MPTFQPSIASQPDVSLPQPPRDYLTDAVRDADDERIAHAEGAVAVGHAGIGPTLREAL